MTKPGFIQHHWTHQRGDSISAARVIEHIENETMQGFGLYYESYHYRVICRLLQLLQTLNATDRITLTDEANRRGFTLNETSIKESRQCYSNIIREIRES